MKKHLLAKELRQRQYQTGIVPKHIIDTISDDDIISAYITCSGCGEVWVNEQNLKTAIKLAQNVNQFFAFCDKFAEARHQKQH